MICSLWMGAADSHLMIQHGSRKTYLSGNGGLGAGKSLPIAEEPQIIHILAAGEGKSSLPVMAARRCLGCWYNNDLFID